MTRKDHRKRAPSRLRIARETDSLWAMLPLTFWLSAALLAVAFMFGGQSRDNPLSTMAIELLGVMLLAALAWSGSLSRMRRASWPETALIGAIFLVPVLQIIPLPPDIWTILPGRREVVETLRVAGVEPGWAPLSLDPESTFRCLLWIVPPAALYLTVTTLDATARFHLAGVILALCIGSLVLGGLQVADPDGGLFASPAGGHTDLPIGFFANRNHQGIAMVAAIPFAAAFAAIWGAMSSHRTRAANTVFVILLVLLAAGVLGTRSRAALILAGPTLIASIGLFWTASGVRRVPREMALMIGAAALAVLLVAQFAIGAVFDRFDTLAEGDGRLEIWWSTLQASTKVAPFGSGLGTFVQFYRALEPLDIMGPRFVNDAHNDYLELWLEAGWLAPAIVLAFLAWLGRATSYLWRKPPTPSATFARAGGIAVLVLLAHSIGDYPLRTQALACVFAFASACIAAQKKEPGLDA